MLLPGLTNHYSTPWGALQAVGASHGRHCGFRGYWITKLTLAWLAAFDDQLLLHPVFAVLWVVTTWLQRLLPTSALGHRLKGELADLGS